MAESLLMLRDILVRYGDKTILEVPHLEVEPGEILALLGANGAGKTTLLRVMGLLQPPLAGTIRFKGEIAESRNALAIRRGIANVFQEPLLLNGTVYQNAGLGLKLRGLSRKEIEARLTPWLDRFGIELLARRSARTLSGGEAQRASLVRALALEPDLLLLDEPFSALDPVTREALWRDFQRVIKEIDVTTIFVTHDRSEAYALADRVGVLRQGKLLQIGSRDDVFLRPVSEPVAEVVGIDNRLAGVVVGAMGDQLEIVIGSSRLFATGGFNSGSRVVAGIRADDIALSRPGSTASQMNCIAGTIKEILPGIAGRRIVVDCCEFSLVALLDRNSPVNVPLRLGEPLTALFADSAVHIMAAE